MSGARLDARIATADALAQELDLDISPRFLAAVDRFLVQLYLRGYKVESMSKDQDFVEGYDAAIKDMAASIEALRAINAELVAAVEQCLDDMGESGHCVCEEAKDMLRAALAKAI